MGVTRRRKVLYGVLGACGVGLLATGTAFAAVDVPRVKDSVRQEASVVQYADGSELARVGSLDRELVPLRDVSKAAQHAVLAAEQRTYWTDPGVSPKGIVRAAWANLRGGGISQGGSTITQQYVKNAYLSDERTFRRKAREAVVALKLSQTRSKAQVLEDYLNTVYFGRGAYGVQVASKTLFGKPAKDLTAGEGAVLASLLRSPSGYDPARNPNDAKARWAYVLDGMVEQGWLSREDRAAATYPKVLKGASKADDRSGPRGYVVELVESELARQGFREGALQSGGLTVRTTLRRDAQAAAVGAVQAVVPKPDTEDQSALQGALVAVRPVTGEVYAYYGGRAGDGGFDYAAQGPQDAGSTMKAYVLAAALEQGIALGTTFDGDSPKSLPGYSKPVRNFGDVDHGRVDLLDATAKSVNTAYVALAAEVGPQQVADLAHRVGIRPDDRLAEPAGPPSLGIALGVYGVRVVDQASAFATFAAGGVEAAPHAVLSVTGPDGDEVYRAERETERVMDADVTSDVTAALRQVVERGTASANGRLAGGRPAIGKTGTTQGSRDAWMVGATPQLAAAVWVGRGDDEPMEGVLGSSGGVTGGAAPARIWKAFLDRTLEGDPVEQFPPAAGVGSVPTPSATPTPSPTPTPTPTATPSPTPTPSPTATPVPSATPPQQPVLPTGPVEGGPVAPGGQPTAGAGTEPFPTPTPTPTRVGGGG